MHFYSLLLKRELVMKNNNGFTLIELMIVIAVIGLLTAIAIPFYSNYVRSSSEQACLQEVKAYSNHTFLSLNDQDDATLPSIPTFSTCTDITDASTWTLETMDKVIQGIPKQSGAKKAECDLGVSLSCQLVP